MAQGTGGTPPTIVSATVLFDCDTQAAPTGEAMMSDGTFEHVKIYLANSDGSSPPISCIAGNSAFNLVDCNEVPVCFFCLPTDFTCNYLAPDGFSSAELCVSQN